jgi:glucose/mannose transport system substrate-binding protein
LVPSFAHGMAVPSAAQGAIVDVVAKFMNSTMSSKDAVVALVKAAKTK